MELGCAPFRIDIDTRFPGWFLNQRMKAQNLREKLSQWEAHLAPLSARQKDGYLQLSTAAASKPLPTQVSILQYSYYQYLRGWEQLGLDNCSIIASTEILHWPTKLNHINATKRAAMSVGRPRWFVRRCLHLLLLISSGISYRETTKQISTAESDNE